MLTLRQLLLQLSNYSSYEGVLYCRPHFDQLFKMTGSLDKSFEGDIEKLKTRLILTIYLNFLELMLLSTSFTDAPRTARVDRSVSGAASSKLTSMFAGTQDKCVTCKKTVYPIEKVVIITITIFKILNSLGLNLLMSCSLPGSCRWKFISSSLLQMQPWRLHYKPF